MPSASFLDVPYELRQRILSFALKQKGTIELQHPVWGGQAIFAQPLFQVCRFLRDEALQAFYETNCFLWIVDSGQQRARRSDPADYPSMTQDPCYDVVRVHQAMKAPLTPALPWKYPHLKKHLRHLNLNIYVNNYTDFSQQLTRLVETLDLGRKLLELHVLFTSGSLRTYVWKDQLKEIEVLAKMEVRGIVKVQTRNIEEAHRTIGSLGLERRMKA